MKNQTGFGIVTAVFLLVMLAVLAVAITFFIGVQRNTVTLDLLSSRAYQAARSGIEWGAFQALQNSSCVASSTLTFPADAGTMAGFTATVTCTVTTANEGGNTITLYNLVSTGCNDTTCPNTNPTTTTYVERQLTALVGG